MHFALKKYIPKDGLNNGGWVCITDFRWLRFGGNKDEMAYLVMF